MDALYAFLQVVAASFTVAFVAGFAWCLARRLFVRLFGYEAATMRLIIKNYSRSPVELEVDPEKEELPC